ncbi:MAG: glutamine amidotransferase [Bacteroidetes bacterium SW_11_64_17]|nr:MAG: glutamine amidotransferase [Bacteroidetes bacterium SW_11_64_17]
MVDFPLTSPPLQVLLVQCRSAPRMEKQEQTCFLERTRLRPDQLHTINVARADDDPSPALLDDADALLIGGAGKYSATQTYPWTEALDEFIRNAVDRRLPTLGSCWGHQVVARALGGRVVHDPERSELGCGWVELTEASAEDPLFCPFPARFRANMGHHDRVVELPPSAIELAHNDQPNQAFRLNDAPVYGTQFHSELDAERERERILVYREYYRTALPDEETVQRVLNNLADTTEVDNLLYDFLMTFVARPHPSVAPSALLSPDGTSPLTSPPEPDRYRTPEGSPSS